MICQWLLIISLPVSLVLLLLPGQLLSLFNPVFIQGVSVLQIIVLANLFNISTGSSGVMLIMGGYPKLNFINASVVGVINVILNIILIPRFGIIGAALSTAVSIIGINTLKLIEIYYIWRFFPYTVKIVKIILVSIVSLVVCRIVIDFLDMENFSEIIIGSLSILSLYLFGLYIFCFTRNERKKFGTIKFYLSNFLRGRGLPPLERL